MMTLRSAMGRLFSGAITPSSRQAGGFLLQETVFFSLSNKDESILDMLSVSRQRPVSPGKCNTT